MVVHIANSGRVIIQLSKSLPEGQVLIDERGKNVAKVNELIGPVAKPYASAIPLSDKVKKYVGKKVFANDQAPAVKTRRYKRKRR
ncbi:MAG: H/ACA ribonucleoprotein complex subunit GAR1 [Nitrosopumilaceae archaeon]